MNASTDSLLACLNLIQCLQNERGLVTLYLCSRGDRARDDLPSIFALTDMALERFSTCDYALDQLAAFLPLSISALARTRGDISPLIASAGEVVTFYTEQFILPLLDLFDHRVLHNSHYIPVRASAFVYLLQWQERLGYEREMVTQLAGQEWMHDDAFVGRLKKIIRERQTYERLFWGIADDTLGQACGSLKKAHQEGRNARPDKFMFFCMQIEALHEAAKKIAAVLIEEKADFSGSGASQSLDTEVEAHFDIIRSLPLFRGLKHDVLREILRPARIVHHDKNSMFLMQGEMSNRFFVILDGWIKIYKSTAEGNEAILQIVGKRDCVMECDCLSAHACPINARTITKSKLLSLPISMMRDYTAQHKALALNLLAASTRRTQRMIAHFEQLMLRSAKERVGAFLLNINLDMGIGGPPLLLPFDKALIAAYLGIKPETFSRILQEFRDKGFKIERQQISLPEPHALCGYCDSESMGKCDLADTDSCPKAEFCRVKFAP